MRFVRNAWWWLKYHTTHRYHLVDCRSKEWGYKYGYQEPSELIFLACFNLLVDYVEKNKPFDKVPGLYESEYSHYRWESDNPELNLEKIKESHRTDNDEWAGQILESIKSQHNTGQEIKALYLWWKEGRPKAQADAESILDGCDYHFEVTEQGQLVPPDERNAELMRQSHEADRTLGLRDQEMLHRLIEIRECLWT